MASVDEEEYVSVSRAAALLAVSKVTLHRWIKRGLLTAYSLGPRRLLLKRADLDLMLKPVLREPAVVYETAVHPVRRVVAANPRSAEVRRPPSLRREPWPELDELTVAVSRLWSGPGAVEEIRLQRARPD